MELLDLPVECLGHIVSYIHDPSTLRDLFLVSKTIAEITRENVESVDSGNVPFLCQFKRLSYVKNPIIPRNETDLAYIATLPRLEVATFQLTSAYFDQVCREIVNESVRQGARELYERMNVNHDISEMIQPNFERIVGESMRMIVVSIYTRYFIRAIDRFLENINGAERFTFVTPEKDCLYSKIAFGHGHLSIDLRETTFTISVDVASILFRDEIYSPFPSIIAKMPITYLRCPNVLLEYREDIAKIIPTLRELIIVTSPNRPVDTTMLHEMLEKASLLIVHYEEGGKR